MSDKQAPQELQPGTPPPEEDLPVSYEDIAMAAYRIRGQVLRSPMTQASRHTSGNVQELYLKHEHRQATGSFKERGALNALMLLSEGNKRQGVIAASAGNHALALAYHGGRLGIPVTVVMPIFAPLAKVNKCRELGASVILYGSNIQEAREKATVLMRSSGQTYINGYDDPNIIAGAGTIGVEILEQVPDVEAVVVPIGGGGLVAGISLAMKRLRPSILVVGVEPVNCDSFTQALKAGHPVQAMSRPTLADGLNVPTVGENAFQIARKYCDKVITVEEKYIALSILRILEGERMVVEGGGASGIAGILSGKLPELAGKKTVAVLCGSNVDVTVLGRVIERGLFVEGRLLQIDVPISDRPGGLSDFTHVINELGANIVSISHERAFIADINVVSVHAFLEVRDKHHRNELLRGLAERGYEPIVKGAIPKVTDTTKLHSARAEDEHGHAKL
eukprot:TRINITY_DN28142_c0_g1_i1.p1 TRINITY_DN28142_c0_g1~~TRINITY_DN28142_c0_g1_i1.p1  ORF type:complete len:449 (+),score=185.25 TRINITY_DN28142_c0_g1_i1:59-1405(+)